MQYVGFYFKRLKQKGLMVDNTSLNSISSAHSFVYYKNILCPCSEFCVLKRGSLESFLQSIKNTGFYNL